jgi:hypothetical protein
MTQIDSAYDDQREERYHFPVVNLSKVKDTVGDWIVYYEPRRKGGKTGATGGRLSATAHWMFDRGLVSLDDDFTILKAKAAAPEVVSRLLLPSGRIEPPPPAVSFDRILSFCAGIGSTCSRADALVEGMRTDFNASMPDRDWKRKVKACFTSH